MRWCYLGRVDYGEALALQLELREAVLARRCPDTLLLLEHPPVITLGRSARAQENVLVTEQDRKQRGVALFRVSRGGDVTYHGPGQLVGYPIRRVGRRVRQHVEGMALAVGDVLRQLQIESFWEDRRPGVWTCKGKIAAVGVDARGGVTLHGFSLNVSPALDHFGMIVPCGLDAAVTSVEDHLGSDSTPGLPRVARCMAQALCQRYGADAEEVAAQELRP